MLLSFLLLQATIALAAAQGTYGPKQAIRAEWERKLPALQPDRLAPAHRERLAQSRRRIGRPGDPGTIPSDQIAPTETVWLAKARAAKSPQDRYTALYWLNRLKSKSALEALRGLRPEDAAAWPVALHLENALATARLNGGRVDADLEAFLAALGKAGKVDPVRAQAARLRLVIGGLEPSLLPPIPDTPRARAAMFEALGRVPLEARKAWLKGVELDRPGSLGLRAEGAAPRSREEEIWVRTATLTALGPTAPWKDSAAFARLWTEVGAFRSPNLTRTFLEVLRDAEGAEAAAFALDLEPRLRAPLERSWLLPVLRKHAPAAADRLRTELLAGSDASARAAAIEDLPSLPEPPAWEALHARVWAEAALDSREALLQALARWDLPSDRRKALLAPWLQHPDWTSRYQAYEALMKLDPATPWPLAPAPSKREEALLTLATRLAQRGRPVRLRFTFGGGRTLVLRLDPTLAPINVANLVTLVRKGFYDGLKVGRFVPDFVVQMGSPYGTMDGGPGHTVRCETSEAWYGPGSVGMALSGKDTGGSQFFITLNAHPFLDGKYTWMGAVEDPDRALPMLDALPLETPILKAEVLPR